jgi:hypothetical protein
MRVELCIFHSGLRSFLLGLLCVVGWKTMVSKAEHARRTIAKIEAKLATSPHPPNQQELEECLARWRAYLASHNPQKLGRGVTRPLGPRYR